MLDQCFDDLLRRPSRLDSVFRRRAGMAIIYDPKGMFVLLV